MTIEKAKYILLLCIDNAAHYNKYMTIEKAKYILLLCIDNAAHYNKYIPGDYSYFQIPTLYTGKVLE